MHVYVIYINVYVIIKIEKQNPYYLVLLIVMYT